MQAVVFVPLAHDIEDSAISKNAQRRVQAGLFAIQEANRTSYVEAIFAFGAGAIPGSDSSKTLAEYTEEYFLKIRSDLPMIVNRDDVEVYGTFNEIKWVIHQSQQCYENPRFVIVSQARHLRRVRLMHRWFFSDTPMDFVVSGQTEEVPLWHEFLGYGKLVLTKLGLGTLADKLRRFTAQFTNW